jgi:hypothetical protein
MEIGQDIKWREDKILYLVLSILYLVLSPFYILSSLHFISCPLSILYLVLSPFMERGQDIKWRGRPDIKWREDKI